MKNLLTNGKTKFSILAIAVAFLFALSPLVTVSLAAQTKASPIAPITKSQLVTPSQLAKMTPEQRVDALAPLLVPSGTPTPKDLGHYSQAQVDKILGISPTLTNKACTGGCSFIADEVGALQVTNNRHVIAEVYTGNSNDPDTCPTGTLVAGGTIFVNDPCGNGYSGEIRTFSESTYAQGTPITSVGYEGVFSALGNDGNIYTTNFGYGTITVTTQGGSFVTTYDACGYYPEFISNYAAGNTLYVGDNYMGYFYDEGCMNAINTSTQVNTDISITNSACGGCATANGIAINQQNGWVYAVDSFSYFLTGDNYVYIVSGTSQTSNTVTISSNAEEPWGAAFGLDNAFIVVPYDAGTGYVLGGFQTIKGTTASSEGIVDTGAGPNAACFNTNHRINIDNTGAGNPSTVTNVNRAGDLNTISISFLGFADPFGCSGS